MKRGDLARALRRYDRAVALAEDEEDEILDDEADPAAIARVAGAKRATLLNRALVYLRLDRPGSARADCDAVLKDDPKNPKARFRRAKALAASGHVDDARRALEALAVDADVSLARDARRALGDVRKTQKEHRAAEKKSFSGVFKSPPKPYGPAPKPPAPPPEDPEAVWRRNLMRSAKMSVERRRAAGDGPLGKW